PEKVSKCSITQAMEEAGCSADDLAFINPHGSGTRKGDASELSSVIDLLGDKKDVPICGMKPYTGHMGAASDIAEIILGINAVENRTVPGTLNFEGTEQKFSGLKISGSHQSCEKDTFLSVSYGIGGQSSAVAVSAG
ncbi:MAG TPA: hypothetical protein ENG80_02040, partial [Nitrospirae bacterium]|nr:hypothetical protein [Nitrospirota bacterium]